VTWSRNRSSKNRKVRGGLSQERPPLRFFVCHPVGICFGSCSCLCLNSLLIARCSLLVHQPPLPVLPIPPQKPSSRPKRWTVSPSAAQWRDPRISLLLLLLFFSCHPSPQAEDLLLSLPLQSHSAQKNVSTQSAANPAAEYQPVSEHSAATPAQKPH